MAGFRSHDGQHSDRMPIKRSLEQKKILLVQLKEQLAGMKPWVADSVRSALKQRIADLEAEIAGGRR
jgi:hypothetical protein